MLNQKNQEDKEANIFISNITITALNNKAEGYVKIIAKDGYNLNQDHAELTFTAVPMLGNQEIKVKTQSVIGLVKILV